MFPDALDEGANLDIGYMPGKLPWLLAKRLEELGMVVKNSKISIDGSVHKDRLLLTGDSPLAGNALGILAADELLKAVGVAEYSAHDNGSLKAKIGFQAAFLSPLPYREQAKGRLKADLQAFRRPFGV